MVLSGSSGITSGARSGSGAGGQISIRATSLDMKETSGITSSTNTIGTDLMVMGCWMMLQQVLVETLWSRSKIYAS